jgi:hypothetical protein
MSYGFYRLGSNVPNKTLPFIGFDAQAGFRVVAASADKPIKPIPATIAETTIAPMGMGVMEAKAQGYTGDQCSHCNSMRMKISGHCMVCESCGTTTGCS